MDTLYVVKTDPEYAGKAVEEIHEFYIPKRSPWRRGRTHTMVLCTLTNGERLWFFDDELEVR